MTDKRPKPVAVCTRCGAVSYNATLINGPCGRGGCKGTRGSAGQDTDWEECPSCSGSGEQGSAKCPECDGVGWIFVRDKGWLRAEIKAKRAKKGP
jgi:DnaJ-class molecular chaperone